MYTMVHKFNIRTKKWEMGRKSTEHKDTGHYFAIGDKVKIQGAFVCAARRGNDSAYDWSEGTIEEFAFSKPIKGYRYPMAIVDGKPQQLGNLRPIGKLRLSK